MKILIMIILTSLATFLSANPNAIISMNAKYDVRSGDLIPPDQILLVKGLKACQKEYYKSCLTYLKKSAAFGNSEAQRNIGLMYIKSLGVAQDWYKGYAWVKLAALDGTNKNKALAAEIFNHLTPHELELAKKEYKKIGENYDTKATSQRRYRWLRKHKTKVLGSRVGAQTSVVRQMKIVGNGKNAVLIAANGKTIPGIDDMTNFAVNYNFGLTKPATGIVRSGEIIPVED